VVIAVLYRCLADGWDAIESWVDFPLYGIPYLRRILETDPPIHHAFITAAYLDSTHPPLNN
jgi:hypothetical protein